jgi:hypothetical protein
MGNGRNASLKKDKNLNYNLLNKVRRARGSKIIYQAEQSSLQKDSCQMKL